MTEKRNGRIMLVQYCMVQALYWMGYCCVSSYAAVFLQSRGDSNSLIGLILALGNIVGFLLAPALATAIDRSKKVTVYHCLFGILIAEAIAELLLMITPGNGLAISVIYIVLDACIVAASPMNTDLCFEMDRSGKYINYGVARGIGSLGYALITLLLGWLCTNRSPEAVLKAGAIMAAVQIAMLLVILLSKKKYALGEQTERYEGEKRGLSLTAFIRKYKRFCLMCFGSGLVMFASGIVSSFAINIVESVGGNASDMGVFSSINAIIEIPMMLLYTRFTKYVRCSNAIRLSSVMFVVRLFLLSIVKSVTGLYLMSISQLLSYALMIPALVDYVSIVIGYEDMAKGQAISAAMMTLGTILASQLGGIMLDNLTVTQTVYVSLAVCTVGTVVCCVTVDSKHA